MKLFLSVLMVLMLSGWIALPAFCDEVALSPNVTYESYQPNAGVQLSSLLQPGAFAVAGGNRYDSFSFTDAVGAAAPTPADLWLVLTDGVRTQPILLVAYPHSITSFEHVEFRVGWRISTLNGSQIFRLTVLGAEMAVQNGGEVQVTQSVWDGKGNSLGSHLSNLSGRLFPDTSNPNSILFFDTPQAALSTSFLVQVDKGTFRTIATGFAPPVPVPEPKVQAMLWAGLATVLWLVLRRAGRLEGR